MDVTGAEQSDIDVKLLVERISLISGKLTERQLACLNDFEKRIVYIERFKRKSVEMEDKVKSYLESLEAHNDPEWQLFSNEEMQAQRDEFAQYMDVLKKEVYEAFANVLAEEKDEQVEKKSVSSEENLFSKALEFIDLETRELSQYQRRLIGRAKKKALSYLESIKEQRKRIVELDHLDFEIGKIIDLLQTLIYQQKRLIQLILQALNYLRTSFLQGRKGSLKVLEILSKRLERLDAILVKEQKEVYEPARKYLMLKDSELKVLKNYADIGFAQGEYIKRWARKGRNVFGVELDFSDQRGHEFALDFDKIIPELKKLPGVHLDTSGIDNWLSKQKPESFRLINASLFFLNYYEEYEGSIEFHSLEVPIRGKNPKKEKMVEYKRRELLKHLYYLLVPGGILRAIIHMKEEEVDYFKEVGFIVTSVKTLRKRNAVTAWEKEVIENLRYITGTGPKWIVIARRPS